MNSRKKAREKKQGKIKPRPVPQKEQVPAPKEPTLEDLIGGIFGDQAAAPALEPEKPVVKPIPSEEFIKQQKEREEQLARAVKFRAHDAKMKKLASSQKAIRDKREASRSGTAGGKVFAGMTLRDAIIAQTILERPYK